MKALVLALALTVIAAPAFAVQRGHGHAVQHQHWHGGPAATHTTPHAVDPVQNDRAHSAPVDRGPGVINGGRAVEPSVQHESRWHHWRHCQHHWTGRCKN